MAIGIRSYRPLVMGTTHMVSSGHHLATAAGYRILEQGGNAVDAGVAAGLTVNVVLPQYTSLGGVAPIIIHHAQKKQTMTISGLGRWPKAASIGYFKDYCKGELPGGILRTVTPAAADAWLTALKVYGTLTFEQVVTPALELAEQGFPVYASLRRALTRSSSGAASDEDGGSSSWPSTQEVFFPGGRPPEVGDLLVQRDLARSFRRLIDAERANASRGREAAIQAARDFFYRGELAEEMVRFHQEQGGLLTLEDLAEFRVKLEPPAMGSYKGIDIYTCGPWCQGPVTIEALQILEGYDLKGMGHNSADYLHTLLEALKLAFADRHAYYGDPEFVDVPMAGLVSQAYAKERQRAIDPRQAHPGMPPAGDPWLYQRPPQVDRSPRRRQVAQPVPLAGESEADTTYICAVDRWGNAFSATPSDTIGGSPLVPGLGFLVSARGSQTWLDPDHPCALAPGKRPRLTPNPALALKDGQLWMPFGSPGGDVQCQSMVQLFLNLVEFGMDPQQAIEAPRARTESFPNSFWPHVYLPGQVGLEGRIDRETATALERRGHRVEVWDDFTPRMGGLCAIVVDRKRGALVAGADPRRDCYAFGR